MNAPPAPPPSLLLPSDILSRRPSGADGISAAVERRYRGWACELVWELCLRLRLPSSVACSGCVLVHRFYAARSLAAHDGHVVAMGAAFLAAKVEEQPRRMRDILNAAGAAAAARRGRPPRPLILGGSLYASWKAGLARTERLLLKETGFSLEGIVAGHPHRLVIPLVRTLAEGWPQAQALARAAWAFLNDASRTDLCCRVPAATIACAAIHLAARAQRIALPKALPWHAVFGTTRGEMLDVAEEILALYDEEEGEGEGAQERGAEEAAGAPARREGEAGQGAAERREGEGGGAQGEAERSEGPVQAAGGEPPAAAVEGAHAPPAGRRPALRWLPSLRPDARPEDDEEEERPGVF